MNGDLGTSTRGRPRILWGRVAFFGVTLVLAFALGAWSASDDTADAELEEARTEIARLTQENVGLRAEKEALEAGDVLDAGAASEERREEPDADDADDADGSGEPEDGEPDAEGASDDAAEDEGASDDGEDSAAGEADDPEAPDAEDAATSTYIVREGDTGHDIAEAVYGDRDLWPLIANANGTDASALQVDQELVIPPAE